MIIFKHVKFKNFLSTGNSFTNIQLDRTSTTLIIGENGAGKSTILDALTFGLFGKPFRKINKPKLMNSINEKNLEVEVEFEIGSNSYLVKRGIKPNLFEIYINGHMVDQVAAVRDQQEYLEKNILKLNYSSFTQIVILGSSTFVPFMQLAAQQRRDIIEDLLDIRIFTTMNLLLKGKISSKKAEISDSKYNIDLNEEKLEVHRKYLKDIQASKNATTQKFQERIKEAEDNIEKIDQNIEDSTTKVDALVEQISHEKSTNKKKTEASRLISMLNSKKDKTDVVIEFFDNNDHCPTCTQDMPSELKEEKINEAKTKILETQVAIEQLVAKESELNQEIEKIQEIQSEISSLQTGINKYLIERKHHAKSIKEYTKDLNEDHTVDNEAAEKNTINELKHSHTFMTNSLEKQIQDKEVLDIAAELLKDKGIKTQIVKQYIPIMNKLINKYLKSMEFFVSFELDENFNEVIKSRHFDEFSYASFSEGEKMRIDLALLLTWRAIAKMKNSTNTNLLILDEVFDASLDNNGCDEFLKLLSELSSNTNVFVISHRGDILQDKFRSVIKFEKRKNFSVMVT